MKKLLIGLLALGSLSCFAGNVKIKGYWNDQIVLSISGSEAKELYDNLETEQVSSSTVNSQTKVIAKRAKSITCNLFTDFYGAHLDYECILAVDSEGRVTK